MVNFVLLIHNFTNYSKKDIDKGNTPLDIYDLCSSIRETFCLSYSIRKDNNLYFYLQNSYDLIKFEGKTLRFLGPDERSQALLLNKALLRINQLTYFENWVKSTPGIFVRKFKDEIRVIKYFITLFEEKAIIISDLWTQENKFLSILRSIGLKEIENYFFIIPTYKKVQILNDFVRKLARNIKINYTSFPSIKSIENKILNINYQIDRIRNTNLNNDFKKR